MRLEILGSLRALDGDGEISLGGAQQRAVLAILAVHRGEAVSMDRLVDLLWDERAPESAAKTVQVYVSRLRKLLGESAVLTAPAGYALGPAIEEIDADRFAALADAGARSKRATRRGPRTSCAERSRSGAVLRWPTSPTPSSRGPRSSGSRACGSRRSRSASTRTSRSGAKWRSFPSSRRSCASSQRASVCAVSLMLALYRSGRQADALTSYREGRAALREELGLERGPALRELEQAILAQDPGLGAPRARRPVAVARARRRGGALIALGSRRSASRIFRGWCEPRKIGLAAAAGLAVAISGGGHGSTAVRPNSLGAIDPVTGRVQASVPTGLRPVEVAAGGGYLWVANRADDTVTQVDPRKRAVVSTTGTGTSVDGLGANDNGVWIAENRAARALRIDPEFRRVTDTVLLARQANLIPSLSPVAVGAGAVWVGNGSAAVSRIDPKTSRLLATIDVGNDPSAIAVGAGAVWIADDADNTITRVDPASANAVTAVVRVGDGPSALAVGAGAVWVANAREDTVSRLDPRSGAAVARIAVGHRPTGIAVAGGAVWVANSVSGTLSRIDPAAGRVTRTVELGSAPQALAVADGRLW